MGDFYQNGLVTTLHDFKHRSYEDLEKKLIQFSHTRPMSLIIPCLYSEIEKPALGRIVNELVKVPFISEYIIGLDQANEAGFKKAKEFFSQFPHHHRVIWNDGPRIQKLEKLLIEKNIAPKELGKGRNAWYCLGYFNASKKGDAVAMHDADIATYDRNLVARLLYPVVDPIFNYKFCKGYYFRADDHKLNGRATRLLVTPLLRTLKKLFVADPFLEFLDSFRYPLAGEFSMRADVTPNIRIPSDWGMEIGILFEIQRNVAIGRICQVDIADRYDHKHQSVSLNNPEVGLSKMSLDISKSIYHRLASNGAVFDMGKFRTIKATYYRIAQDILDQYNSDAELNGYEFDRHAEEEMIDVFARNVYTAGEVFLNNPMRIPWIPSWKRVISAIPGFLDKLYEAVEMDQQEN
jgi:glucosyl-3-phosphoglycerate synthase